MSGPHVEIFYFNPEAKGTKEYKLWEKLIEAGILVKEYLPRDTYNLSGSKFKANASAGLNCPGQIVVMSFFGTMHYYVSTCRISSPNPDPELMKRLRVILPPFQPVAHQMGMHAGRLPRVVRSMMTDQMASWGAAVGFRH